MKKPALRLAQSLINKIKSHFQTYMERSREEMVINMKKRPALNKITFFLSTLQLLSMFGSLYWKSYFFLILSDVAFLLGFLSLGIWEKHDDDNQNRIWFFALSSVCFLIQMSTMIGSTWQ